MIKLLIYICILFIVTNIAIAQFGKNKVQYDDFDWKFIETENFDIYYSNGTKHLAEYAANISENAINSISKTLNYTLTKRINLIIYNSHNEFQQTNTVFSYMSEGIGGVTEMLKNRVIFPFQGDYKKFKHVIHHELVHAVLNDMLFGGNLMTAVNTGKKFDFPLFMNEGLAEWESTGGLNTETDVFMRDLALNNDEYLNFNYLNGYLAYRGGQSFYDYISTKYGKEKIRELISRSKILNSVDEGFKSTFNLSMEDFSEQWKDYLKKQYFPDIALFDKPNEIATRLTNHKKENSYYNTSPAISPNGEKIAYISDIDQNYDIYIYDLQSKVSKKIVSSMRKQDFEQLNILTPGISWNPEGTKLVVSAKAGPEDAIFFVNITNGDYKKLTFGMKLISSVKWSPDGNNIVFTGLKNGQSDLYIYSFYTNNIEHLTNDVYSDLIPVWSPDSKKVYFVSDREDEIGDASKIKSKRIWNQNVDNNDIYSIDIKSKIIERITNDPQFEKTDIIVSPDQNSILYITDINGIGNIYNLNLKSRKVFPVTNTLTNITQMSANQNGTKLVFSSLIDGGYDLFLINNPFTLKYKVDTLPLTKLRKKDLELIEISKNINNLKNVKVIDSLKGYGEFEISLNKQQNIKANQDLIKNNNINLSKTNIDTSFIERDYKINFSLDYMASNPYFSTYYGAGGNAFFLFSDVMGDHQITAEANLVIDLNNSNFNISYYYLRNKLDWSFSIFHYSSLVTVFEDLVSSTLYARFNNLGITAKAILPFNTFTRLEGGISLLNLSKKYVDYPELPSLSRIQIVPEMSFVFDNVRWGWYAPNDGTRLNLNLKGTPKLFDDAISFATIKTDIRNYNSFFKNYITVASRLSAGLSLGSNPQKFFLGGTENWINRSFNYDVMPFNQPEDFAFMNFEMPLRGYSVNDLRGTQFFLGNFELRFPLFTALIAGPVPILLQGVMGTMFFDIGGAWSGELSSFKSTKIDLDGSTIPNDLFMSAGVGVRSYLFGLPIKLDIAWKNEYRNWSEPFYVWSLGYDF